MQCAFDSCRMKFRDKEVPLKGLKSLLFNLFELSLQTHAFILFHFSLILTSYSTGGVSGSKNSSHDEGFP